MEFIGLLGRHEPCNITRVSTQTQGAKAETGRIHMTAQAMKMIFDNNQYLEAMESKTRDQIETLSVALFQLYRANTESLNQENVFQMVRKEN